MLLTRSLWRSPRKKTRLPLGNILDRKQSLKRRIIEFHKVFCFVFTLNYCSVQNEVGMCVLREINCVVFLGGLCCCFCQKWKVTFWVGTQVEAEAARWLALRAKLKFVEKKTWVWTWDAGVRGMRNEEWGMRNEEWGREPVRTWEQLPAAALEIGPGRPVPPQPWAATLKAASLLLCVFIYSLHKEYRCAPVIVGSPLFFFVLIWTLQMRKIRF